MGSDARDDAPVAVDDLRAWIGRTETREDHVTPTPVAALAATLDRDDPAPVAGDALPPLWHWLYFLPLYRQSELGPDGHAMRGGFLPPVPLPRRMWAGGRLTFMQPLRIGERIARVSRIADVTTREGRSGALTFVLVRHEIAGERGPAIVEEHDIVYRGAPRPGEQASAPLSAERASAPQSAERTSARPAERASAPQSAERAAAPQPAERTSAPRPGGRPSARQPAPADAEWERTIHPDDVLLFRYSALTFNGHRIHYDRRYVTEVEGYPGLVVHGPLIATLLLDLLRRNRPEAIVATFVFRASSPLFDIAPFRVAGRIDADRRTARLWAATADRNLAMDATATLA